MGKKKFESQWHSAVCYDAKTMAKETRKTLNKLGYTYERERAYKPYSKLVVILPLPKFSYVFQFKVNSPAEFIINLYDTNPTHSGVLHLLEVLEITPENLKHVKDFLKSLSGSLPRKPWRFFWGERFQYAIAAPEYLRAKKAWRKMDVE
jgi:hypothetical protein